MRNERVHGGEGNEGDVGAVGEDTPPEDVGNLGDLGRGVLPGFEPLHNALDKLLDNWFGEHGCAVLAEAGVGEVEDAVEVAQLVCLPAGFLRGARGEERGHNIWPAELLLVQCVVVHGVEQAWVFQRGEYCLGFGF